MKDVYFKKRRIVMTFVVFAGIFSVVFVFLLANKDKIFNNPKDFSLNYKTVQEGEKINISKELIKIKKIGDISFEKSNITYKNGVSELKSKVTNGSTDKTNLRFKIIFMNNNKEIIAEAIAFVGSIKANEIKCINSYITADVSNAKDIVYELMD